MDTNIKFFSLQLQLDVGLVPVLRNISCKYQISQSSQQIYKKSPRGAFLLNDFKFTPTSCKLRSG